MFSGQLIHESQRRPVTQISQRTFLRKVITLFNKTTKIQRTQQNYQLKNELPRFIHLPVEIR